MVTQVLCALEVASSCKPASEGCSPKPEGRTRVTSVTEPAGDGGSRLMTDSEVLNLATEPGLQVSFFFANGQNINMKRIRCPKCNHFNTFDETLYTNGQSLVFECESCRRQFRIKIGTAALTATRKEASVSKDIQDMGFGTIEVIENVFAYHQSFPLKEGDNIIGRYNPGDKITIPIDTTDRSMDRRHCIITVKKEPSGEITYTLRDFPSLTGTFLSNRILSDNERARIEDGAVITIGATTLILIGHQSV